jgi:2-dehydro-3-deoxy-D-gluconate 5-dehydrogenase
VTPIEANMFSLQGRHIVVTGAGRGLGRAMAFACAQARARLTLVARSLDQLIDAAEELRSVGADANVEQADLSDPDEVVRLAEKLGADGAVDGLVHAAGIQVRSDAVAFDVREFRRVLAINLEAPFLLSREVAREQIARGQRGSHVLIGSLGSSIAIPRAVAYAASKSGLLGVTRTLAAEWAPTGVRVNALAPGYFETELTADLLAQPDQRARILSRIPMGRLGGPHELGGAVVFLLSEASSYITGELINVDGGWLAS